MIGKLIRRMVGNSKVATLEKTLGKPELPNRDDDPVGNLKWFVSHRRAIDGPADYVLCNPVVRELYIATHQSAFIMGMSLLDDARLTEWQFTYRPKKKKPTDSGTLEKVIIGRPYDPRCTSLQLQAFDEFGRGGVWYPSEQELQAHAKRGTPETKSNIVRHK